jgi:hypothetical protein
MYLSRLVSHHEVNDMIVKGKTHTLPMRFNSIVESLGLVSDTLNSGWAHKFENMLVTSPPMQIGHGWVDFLQFVARNVAFEYLVSVYFWDLIWNTAGFVADHFRNWYIKTGRYDFEFDGHPFSFHHDILFTKTWTHEYFALNAARTLG